ncbi:MAG: hypothetical protein DMF77_25370 [Acidobacteria bacterium]|nr:MAG: hypothetical protein DMF77_25370 [Acidobacteriota bacterium]
MDDALRVAEAPVIFSHSSAKALDAVPRDVPDDILRRVGPNGGVVMVTFVAEFISKASADASAARDKEIAALTKDVAPIPCLPSPWPRWPITSSTCARWRAPTTWGWAGITTATATGRREWRT